MNTHVQGYSKKHYEILPTPKYGFIRSPLATGNGIRRIQLEEAPVGAGLSASSSRCNVMRRLLVRRGLIVEVDGLEVRDAGEGDGHGFAAGAAVAPTMHQFIFVLTARMKDGGTHEKRKQVCPASGPKAETCLLRLESYWMHSPLKVARMCSQVASKPASVQEKLWDAGERVVSLTLLFPGWRAVRTRCLGF